MTIKKIFILDIDRKALRVFDDVLEIDDQFIEQPWIEVNLGEKGRYVDLIVRKGWFDQFSTWHKESNELVINTPDKRRSVFKIKNIFGIFRALKFMYDYSSGTNRLPFSASDVKHPKIIIGSDEKNDNEELNMTGLNNTNNLENQEIQ